MSYPNWYLAEKEMGLRLKERHKEAEVARLVRQLRPQRGKWLARQTSQLLHRSGHYLVTLGERLQRHRLSQSHPLEGQLTRSR